LGHSSIIYLFSIFVKTEFKLEASGMVVSKVTAVPEGVVLVAEEVILPIAVPISCQGLSVILSPTVTVVVPRMEAKLFNVAAVIVVSLFGNSIVNYK